MRRRVCWLLAAPMLILCLTAAAWGEMSDYKFCELCLGSNVITSEAYEADAQKVLAALLDGANPNAIANNMTALMCGVQSGNRKIISHLLKAGANVNARNNDNFTALMMAVIIPNWTGRPWPKIVSLLLEAGADVNVRTKNDQTALMLAVKQAIYTKTPEIVSLLLRAGADVNAKDKDGLTVLDYLRHQWWSSTTREIDNILTDAGGKPSVEGMYRFGNRLITGGDNIKVNREKGVEYLRRASAQGHQKAKNALKMLGEEVPTNGRTGDNTKGYGSGVANQKKPETISKAMSDEEYLEMKKGSPAFAKADKELNQVWKKAKKTLGKSAFNKLEKEQREWISKGRDAKANHYIDGGMSRMEAYTAATEDRVQELSEIVNGRVPNAKDMGCDAANASIAGDKVNVRSKPNTSAQVVKQLNTGHPVTIIRQDGDWFLIRTASGTEGWVFAKFVTR